MVLESLGKTGTSVPVIMREKEALTDPQHADHGGDRLGPVQVRQGRNGCRAARRST